MEYLKVKPIDNTFFRMGNSFELQESNKINSKNMPYPSTFWGALFAAVLAKNEKLKELILSKEDTKELESEILKLKKVYLYNEKTNQIYIKAPKDLFLNKENDEVKRFDFHKLKDGYSSLNYEYYLKNEFNNENYERMDDYYVKLYDFIVSYNKNKLEIKNFLKEDQIFLKNSKLGIKIDKKTSMVEDGLLYNIEQTEFKGNHWSFILEYKLAKKFENESTLRNIKKLDSGFLKLGGENKVCVYEKWNEKYEEKMKKKYRKLVFPELKKGEFAKIIFTSNAYFKQNLKNIFDEEVELVGLVNDKPIYIGGFDIKESKAKKMYRGYPAGSILLLKLKDDFENAQKLVNYIENKLNSGFKHNDNKNRRQNGFNEFVLFKANIK